MQELSQAYHAFAERRVVGLHAPERWDVSNKHQRCCIQFLRAAFRDDGEGREKGVLEHLYNRALDDKRQAGLHPLGRVHCIRLPVKQMS